MSVQEVGGDIYGQALDMAAPAAVEALAGRIGRATNTTWAGAIRNLRGMPEEELLWFGPERTIAQWSHCDDAGRIEGSAVAEAFRSATPSLSVTHLSGEDAKYAEYVPVRVGADEYMETLVSMSANPLHPRLQEATHWDGKEGLLFHLRTMTVPAQCGVRRLLVCEVQSELHQAGARHGYDPDPHAASMRLRRKASDATARAQSILTDRTRMDCRPLVQAMARAARVSTGEAVSMAWNLFSDAPNAVRWRAMQPGGEAAFAAIRGHDGKAPEVMPRAVRAIRDAMADRLTAERLSTRAADMVRPAPFSTSWARRAMALALLMARERGLDGVEVAAGAEVAASVHAELHLTSLTWENVDGTVSFHAKSGSDIISRTFSAASEADVREWLSCPMSARTAWHMASVTPQGVMDMSDLQECRLLNPSLRKLYDLRLPMLLRKEAVRLGLESMVTSLGQGYRIEAGHDVEGSLSLS